MCSIGDKCLLGISLETPKPILICDLYSITHCPCNSPLYAAYPQSMSSPEQAVFSGFKCSIIHSENSPGRINAVSPYLFHNSRRLSGPGSEVAAPEASSSSPFCQIQFYSFRASLGRFWSLPPSCSLYLMTIWRDQASGQSLSNFDIPLSQLQHKASHLGQ